MRDSEFRSWDDNYDEFAYFKNGKYIGSTSRTPIKARFNWGKFEEYTGLKDKNGVKIYEGDIIRIEVMQDKYKTYTIIFDNDNSRFNFDSSIYELRLKHCNYYEIIGNIHEQDKEKAILDTKEGSK